MGEPAEITVVFGDGAVPGTRTFVKPFSQIDARAHGLAAGASPTASVSGSDTTPILSLGIPKGDKGDTGPQGDPGPRGLPGPKGEPGGSEEAIAEYFRRAASRPMQALAELGVPRPYPSKTAIYSTRGSSAGDKALDSQTGWVYVWDGSQWKVWDSPAGTNALNVSLAGGITTYEGDPFYTVRSGMCTVMINFYKSGGFNTAARTKQTVFTGLPSNLRPSWIIPATFSTDIGVIVYGSLNPNGTFGVDHISDSNAWVRAIMTWPTI